MILIPFEKTDGTYTLRDTIVLKEDHTMSEADIEALKQQRFDNWIAIITASPVDASQVIDNTQAV